MPMVRYLARQLGLPTGWFGRHVLTRMLNRGNRRLIGATIDALALASEDRYLDVGFGGGVSLALAAERARLARLAGVDLSADMVEWARQRFGASIEGLEVELEVADVAHLPFADGAFTKVSTVNTIYFWPDLVEGLQSICRVLAPGGVLAIGMSGADKMRRFWPVTRHGFRIFEPEDVCEQLGRCEFVDARFDSRRGPLGMGDFVIVGRKKD